MAWGVQLFTASGLICLLLAMRAGVSGDYPAAVSKPAALNRTLLNCGGHIARRCETARTSRVKIRSFAGTASAQRQPG